MLSSGKVDPALVASVSNQPTDSSDCKIFYLSIHSLGYFDVYSSKSRNSEETARRKRETDEGYAAVLRGKAGSNTGHGNGRLYKKLQYTSSY